MSFQASERYQVVIPRDVEKEIKNIPKADRIGVFEKLEQLAAGTMSLDVKKLAGFASLYRLRYRDYRIVYEIQDTKLIIHVVLFGHRREVYKKLSRLY